MKIIPRSLMTLALISLLEWGEAYDLKGQAIQVISPRDLEPILATVRVVDARTLSQFRGGHIPNSQHMNWQDWTQVKPGFWSYWINGSKEWGKVFPASAVLEKRLQNLGLSNDQMIVVVGHPHGWGEEGRVAWNLLYWGANQVALLDGGFPAWSKAGGAIEKGEAKFPSQGNFHVMTNEFRRATKNEVNLSLKTDTQLLDARSKEEFNGKAIFGQKRGGKIPGAKSIPVDTLYQEDGSYIRDFPSINHTNKKTIAYCVGGVRSALLALLIEVQTGQIVANYDGSIWEWASDPELPMDPSNN